MTAQPGNPEASSLWPQHGKLQEGLRGLQARNFLLWGRSAGDSRYPNQDRNAHNDPVHRERGEPTMPDPRHEPGDSAIRYDERNQEADRHDNPSVRINLRNADGVFAFAPE